MKVAAYLRVSTGVQTTDNQRQVIEEWIKARGYEISEVYQENESAWRLGHQHELARLLDDLRSGRRKYDIVVVWALDRLTREGIATILLLVNTFKTYGCRVFSLQDAWTQQDGMMSELLYAITAWVANFESTRLSERVKAGQDRAVKQGKTLGRPEGSRDKKPRRKSGYWQRFAGK